MKRHVVISLCLAALIQAAAVLPSAALAAEGAKPAAKAAPKGGCIELSTVAEREETLKNADGSETKRLVPAKHIVPDTEVVWTATALAIPVVVRPGDVLAPAALVSRTLRLTLLSTRNVVSVPAPDELPVGELPIWGWATPPTA